MTRAGSHASAVALSAMLAAATSMAACGHRGTPLSGGPHRFDGHWSATGERRSIATEGFRRAALIELSGAIVLSGQSSLSGGFQAVMIGFDDGRDLRIGRALWTDANGDCVFSVLDGYTMEPARRIRGVVTGGTGRYAGANGVYELSWQYTINADAGAVQGRSTDLTGTIGFDEVR